MTNAPCFIFPLSSDKAIDYLSSTYNIEITQSQLYQLILDGSLSIYVKLFESEKAALGRFLPFNDHEYQELKKNNDKRLSKHLRWVKPNKILFDKKKSQPYFISNKKVTISGDFKLSMLGSEFHCINNLYIKDINTRTTKEKIGYVIVTKGKKIYRLISTKRMKWHNNHSILIDFSHQLVFKQQDLDNLGSLLKKQSGKKTSIRQNGSLTSGTAISLKKIITPLLLKQGISLQQPDIATLLDKLVILNNLKLPSEAILHCKNLLRAGTLSAEVVESVKEEELLILLSSLLNQEGAKTDNKKAMIKAIKNAQIAEPNSEKFEHRTISKYVDKIISLDTDKYTYITE